MRNPIGKMTLRDFDEPIFGFSSPTGKALSLIIAEVENESVEKENTQQGGCHEHGETEEEGESQEEETAWSVRVCQPSEAPIRVI